MGENKLCPEGSCHTEYVKGRVLADKLARGKLPLLVKLIVIRHMGFGNYA